MTAEHEKQLIISAQAGDNNALGELLTEHEGWFRKQAKFFAPTEDIDDYLQEANIAAIECLKKFDASLGFRFLTYATKKILWRLRKVKLQDKLVLTPGVTNYGALSEKSRKRARQAHRFVDVDRVGHILFSDEDIGATVAKDEEIEMLRDAMETLCAQDQRVIRSRMRGEKIHEIAKALRLSKQRVQQIEIRARVKIAWHMRRHPFAKSNLKDAHACAS